MRYSQTQRKELAAYWKVKTPAQASLQDEAHYRYRSRVRFWTIQNSPATVQHWSLVLISYDYSVTQQSVKNTQHRDFWSRYFQSPVLCPTSDCLLMQLLSVRRQELIQNTRIFLELLSWSCVEDDIMMTSVDFQIPSPIDSLSVDSNDLLFQWPHFSSSDVES